MIDFRIVTILFILIASAVCHAKPVEAFTNAGPTASAASFQDSPEIARKYDGILSKSAGMSLKQINDSVGECLIGGRLDEGMLWCRSAISRNTDNLSKEDEMQLARIYSNCGAIYLYENNDPSQSYNCLKKALDISEKYKGEGFALRGLYVSLARLFSNYGCDTEAIAYLRQGFRKNLDAGNLENVSYIYPFLVQSAWMSESLGSIEAEREEFRRIKDRLPVLDAYNRGLDKAASLYMEGKYKECIDILRKIPGHLDSEINNSRYEVATYILAALVADKMEDMGLSSELFQEIDSVMDNPSNSENMADFDQRHILMELKSRYYKRLGDDANYMKYSHEAQILKDSLYGVTSFNKVRALDMASMNSDFEHKLQDVERKRFILETKNRTQRIIITIVGVCSVIIIVLLVAYILKIRRLKDCNVALFDKNLRVMKDMDSETEKRKRNSEDRNPESGKSDDDDILFDRIKAVLSESKEVFNPEFSVEDLSRLVGSRAKAVSTAIHDKTNQKFGVFISEYRIREACRILMQPSGKGGRPTMEALAEMVGYKSRTHFSKVFKNVTGMTATEFMKQASRQEIV